jgi:two-component system response regulator HydG
MSRILVIDDDHDIVALLKRFLTKNGYEVESAFTGNQGEKMLDAFKPDLVMCDYRLDDMDGTTLLMKIKERNPNLPVIIITGYSDLRTAIKVVRMGAFDYITKPLIPDEILLNIKQALNQEENTYAQAGSPRAHRINNANGSYLFSNAPASKQLQTQIDLVAPTDYSVLVYGESGAGKEGVARLIHERSKRATKPFVAMDCGAISKDLAGSELFGHEKGSFTGALNQKIGHFEMADKGTLFLDEVANLPYEMQTLLLRVLQEKVLRRIGSNKEIDIDVRIIVASNERLTEAIARGKFREDLYHRLNEFSIEVQPLRNRKEDIMFFANHFLKSTAEELGKNVRGFDHEVESIFMNYPWYGNIRELKNVIKRSVLLSSGELINVKCLPFEILNFAKLEFNEPLERERERDYTSEQQHNYNSNNNYSSNNYTNNNNHSNTAAPTVQPHVSAPEPDKPQLKKAALEAEYEIILSALNKSNFNKSKAADMLGIDRKTLYNKMKQMKLLDK